MDPQKPHIHLFGSEIQVEEQKEGEESVKADAPKEERKVYKYKAGKCRGDLAWGVIMLSAGIVLLLNSIGIIPWEFWNNIWKFWPALLILLGISVILGRNWFSAITVSLVALAMCFIVIVYSLIQINSPLVTYLPTEIINFVNNINLK